MNKTIRWGILGTGWICRKFTADLKLVEGAEVVAVASRAQEPADVFARAFGIPRAHASYAALAADPDVDIIYVGTPHNLHLENTLLGLTHGKAVLCEKPIAVNSAQLEIMLAEARKRDLFLMEAMWMVFFPVIRKIRELIADGAIGEVRMIFADFCMGFLDRENLNPRLIRPELAGGTLLDMGIYPLSFAHYFMGEMPESISATAILGDTGVDIQTDMVLRYSGRRSATLTSSMLGQSGSYARIVGSTGTIEMPSMYFFPDHFTLRREHHAETFQFPLIGTGMFYEAEAVTREMQQGHKECPQMPHAFSREICQLLDAVREQIGLRYPFE